MIKINLLKNVGMAKSSEIGGGAPGDGALGGGPATPEDQKAAGIKLAVIAVFPILLMIYEKISIDDIQERVNQITIKIDGLTQERSKFGDAAPKIEKYNKEKQRIDKELDIVRGIARNRLRELKALDAIQSIMPNKTWAKRIIFKAGMVTLEGYSDGDEGVTELIRALENNVYFSKVEVKYTTSEGASGGTDANSASGAQLKKFEIDFRIGKQE